MDVMNGSACWDRMREFIECVLLGCCRYCRVAGDTGIIFYGDLIINYKWAINLITVSIVLLCISLSFPVHPSHHNLSSPVIGLCFEFQILIADSLGLSLSKIY